ncbi:hypothetical protein AHAS_Ahas10G0085100 [Arachis hypogaea]
MYKIILILNKCTKVSGQKINLDKSGLIFWQQVSIQKRINIKGIIGIVFWDDLGKYLGLPSQ